MPSLKSPQQTVAENVARVREEMAQAAVAAGRDPSEIQLVAVSKYVDAATASLILSADCFQLAESRPQSLWEKAAFQDLAGVHWHLVGRLQRNKVRRTLPLVELIHSVDSEQLLNAIEEHASALGLPKVRILLEVNCSGDQAKQGFTKDGARSVMDAIERFDHVSVQGLMTMASLEGGTGTARSNFAALRGLRDELNEACSPSQRLSELSMGMSDDFAAGIAEGATMVRIGSRLFEGLPHRG